MQIAVDGPAGAGKSSIAKIVAQKLGLEYIDSGAIYRALAKKILDSNIKIEDYASIKNTLESTSIELVDGDVFIDGVNFMPFIRSSEVTAVVKEGKLGISYESSNSKKDFQTLKDYIHKLYIETVENNA